jgi:hypothetical protein
MSSQTSHKKGGHHVSRAEKKRRGRLFGFIVLGLPALALIFYTVDRTGSYETVTGTVVETSSYVHNGRDRRGEHTHVSAVVEYEGHRYKVEPGDRFQQGQAVSVEVRRGRLSNYPYFVQAW